MPDLSDKVSEHDGIPQDVWDTSDATAEFIATALAAAIFGKATSEDVAVSITKAVSNAIMADRRTRPAASTMEGWRLMPVEMTGPMWVAGRKAFETEAERYRSVTTSAMAMATADRAPEKIWAAELGAAPIPPEVKL